MANKRNNKDLMFGKLGSSRKKDYADKEESPKELAPAENPNNEDDVEVSEQDTEKEEPALDREAEEQSVQKRGRKPSEVKKTQISVSFNDDDLAFIRKCVSAGVFPSVNDFAREAIREMLDKNMDKYKKELKKALEIALSQLG